eukprot:scaffold179898_cov34-Prasinocladus_malaysianus.AAC.1
MCSVLSIRDGEFSPLRCHKIALCSAHHGTKHVETYALLAADSASLPVIVFMAQGVPASHCGAAEAGCVRPPRR